MKKQKFISILSVFCIIFLLQKNGFSQNNNSLNQIDADKNFNAGTNITEPNDNPSKMQLSIDKEGITVIDPNNNNNNGNNNNNSNNGNTPNDSLDVVSDFIISTEKDPQNN